MSTTRRKRILLVEDEALVAMLLEDMIQELGFEVVGPALRLERAAELVDSEVFDAAILDVNLGGCRSYPIAERLVAKGVPFAFATGYGSPGVVEWRDRVPLIRKPFEKSTLSSVVEGLLDSERSA